MDLGEVSIMRIKQILTPKVLMLPLLAGMAVGCASSGSQAPTHRWANSEVADQAAYRIDHAQCASKAGLKGEKAFATDSEQFVAYKQCMNDNGYVLTAYRGND